MTAPAPSSPPSPRVSATELVYQHVKERILDHDLQGGELISEGEIAATLEVSRTPVREGFIRLQTEGWMTLYPKRGALVREVGPHEIRDVVQARIMVESQSVRTLIAAGRHQEVARELEEILRQHEAAHRAGDHEDFVGTDARFHQHIVAAAGNQLITGFYRGLEDRQRRMAARSTWKQDHRAQIVADGHRELLHLLEEADAAGFEASLTEHLTSVHRELLA